MFEPGWKPDPLIFIEKASRGPKTIRSSPAQTHSHFLWNAKRPYNHCWDTIFFSILNLHGGYIYVWAGLKPDWFHWQLRPGDSKQFDPSPAQTNSHSLWNAKLPYNHCWDTIFFSILNLPGGYIYVWAGLRPDWIPWQVVQGTQNNSIQPGSDPFPFSMERQTSQ